MLRTNWLEIWQPGLAAKWKNLRLKESHPSGKSLYKSNDKRFLSPEGIPVGLTDTPWLREEGNQQTRDAQEISQQNALNN